MYSVFLMPGPLTAAAAPPALPAPPPVPPVPPTLLTLLLLPGRLFQLSTREATGLPPADVLLVAPRLRAAALFAGSAREG